MRISKFHFAGVASLASILAPAVSQAQVGLIIVAPTSQAAPAVGSVAMALLCAGLLFLGVSYLRRTQLGLMVGLLTLGLAGLVQATSPDRIIQGDACNERQELFYNNTETSDLISRCSNTIQIVELDPCYQDPCETLGESFCGSLGEAIPDPNSIGTCVQGMVLPPHTKCGLPSCTPP